jgi:hypothetical protein
MGNILNCTDQSDQLRKTELALEQVKEEADFYKKRISGLEEQIKEIKAKRREKEKLRRQQHVPNPSGCSDSPDSGAERVRANYGAGIISPVCTDPLKRVNGAGTGEDTTNFTLFNNVETVLDAEGGNLSDTGRTTEEGSITRKSEGLEFDAIDRIAAVTELDNSSSTSTPISAAKKVKRQIIPECDDRTIAKLESLKRNPVRSPSKGHISSFVSFASSNSSSGSSVI